MVLSNPWESGINITNITGIGPEKADILSANFALVDGSRWTHSRQPYRNIVMTIKYTDNCSIEEVRHKTYKFFKNKDLIRLTFKTTVRTLIIDGYVESNEPDIFQKESGAQISIICLQPYFRLPNQTVLDFSNSSNQIIFPYLGDIDTGVYFRFVWDSAVPQAYNIDQIILRLIRHFPNGDQPEQITISNLQASIGRPFSVGDKIELSTVKGDKHCNFIGVDGTVRNLINHVDFTNGWTLLTTIPSFPMETDNIGKYTLQDASPTKLNGLVNANLYFDNLYNGI